MKRVAVLMVILAVSLLVGSQVAWAGKANGPLANVVANAVCTVLPQDDGTVDVKVSAVLVQRDGGAVPFVSSVDFSMEEHRRNTNQWFPIASANVTVGAAFPQEAGESTEVAFHIFEDICAAVSDDNVNALRGVVGIKVDNSIKGTFIGRCISFPNPCK